MRTGKIAKNVLAVFMLIVMVGNAMLIAVPPASAFSWGKLDAHTDHSGVYSIGQYDIGEVNITVTYNPYFFAFFPIWMDIKVSEKPSWLDITLDQRTSAIKPRTSKTVKVDFQMDTLNVKAGTVGNFAFNITGEPIKGKRFLQIEPARVYVQVKYAPSLPPIVNITFPPDGAEVSNTVVIRGNASDADGDTIQKVEINLGDGNWIAVNGTSSWSYSWNTTGLINRDYVIQARSYDGSEYSTIKSVTVRVNNEKEGDSAYSIPGFGMVLFILAIASVGMLKKRKER